MTTTTPRPPRLWKVTGPNGEAVHNGSYRYDLPRWSEATRDYVPGRWTPRITDLVPCRRGYHVVDDAHLVNWLNYGEHITEVEVRGRVLDCGDGKWVAESIRLVRPTPWDATTAWLFAAECAADVLALMTDERSRDALDVSFRFALGDATDTELHGAARDAWVASAARAAWAASAAWAVSAVSAASGAIAALRVRQTARLLWWIGASDTYPDYEDITE